MINLVHLFNLAASLLSSPSVTPEATLGLRLLSDGLKYSSMRYTREPTSTFEREGGLPKAREWTATLALAQGLFYIVTGVWPLLHMQSFERISGPKVDHWLVKTVGLLLTVIGSVLMIDGLRQRTELGSALLGVGSAGALTAIDVIYVAKKRIWPVYLLDAVVETGLIALWIWRKLLQRGPMNPISRRRQEYLTL
jgi:hypothetical protein